MRVMAGMFERVPGVTYKRTNELADYQVTNDALRLHAIHYEGDDPGFFGGCVVTVEAVFIAPGVVRLRYAYNAGVGDRSDKYDLDVSVPLPLCVTEEDSVVVASAADYRLTCDRQSMRLAFFNRDGDEVASTTEDGIGIFYQDGSLYLTEKLEMAAVEQVYGFGERFSPFVKNGQSVSVWNTDAQTVGDRGYKEIPFFISNRGYGVLVNTSREVQFEVATEDHSAVRVSVAASEMELVVFVAESMKSALSKYFTISGLPSRLPDWSFGLWLTTSFTTEYSEEIVTEHVSGMLERDLPVSVFHFDSFWMKKRHWCDYKWNLDLFPRPTDLLNRLAQQGIRTSVWINPYVSCLSDLFSEAEKEGFFLTTRVGSVYQFDWFQPGMALIDFTNPAAVEWFQDKLRALTAMGVDTFKSDFGESVPADAVAYNGMTGEILHNRYALLYNQAVFQVLNEEYGAGNAVVFARSASVGSSSYPVHWGGDSIARYSHMAAQLRGALSFGLSGGAFWSTDIGGFFGNPTPDLYKRWIAFGLLCSHSRLHGNRTYRVPWLFDEESVDVLHCFLSLRMLLLPYIRQMAEQAYETGLPMLRPMVLEFPEDPTCAWIDTQYMFGDSLLVAPVLNAQSDSRHYLPPGMWFDWFSERWVEGGAWYGGRVGYNAIPLFAKEGAVIPLRAPREGAPSAAHTGGYQSGATELLFVGLPAVGSRALPMDDRFISLTVTEQSGARLLEFSEEVTFDFWCVHSNASQPAEQTRDRLCGTCFLISNENEKPSVKEHRRTYDSFAKEK